MNALLLAALLATAPATHGRAALAPSDTIPAAPGVRLIVNRDEFGTGDPVRVQVETAEDGYLVVMRVDGDGRVRVVFPIDPDLDPFVRGGKRYELRGRGASETFLADDLGGAGIIFAALSRDPLRFSDYATGDHWDYEALRLGDLRDDPEAALHRVVRRMSNDGRYTFDVKGYRVHAVTLAATTYTPTYIGVRDPYRCYSCYGGGIHVSIGLGGWRDPWDPWYDPYWYDPYRYDPYRYDPYWSARAWYPPFYPGQYAPYTVVNYRPRPAPNPHDGGRARPRVVSAPVGAISGVTAAVRPVHQPAATTSRQAPAQDRSRPRPAAGSQTGAGAPPAQVAAPDRDRRPTRAAEPPVSTTAADQGAVTQAPRSRPAPTQDRTSGATSTPTTQRVDAPRPVFRDPVPDQSARDRRDPPTEQRPVYREPERPRAAPPSSGSGDSRTEPKRDERKAEPQRDERRAEPQREERKPEPQPASRAPAAAPRTTPPPPPPPPPASSGGGRSRARVGGGG